ncbi:hypothetical protein SDC9_128363 [bioreactor metagenome]|uniref:Uncharacterized protein n=1 Tax=bioreactor metagenome TaxID=1076179 RepID=A0A645CWM6_9ZZZZ
MERVRVLRHARFGVKVCGQGFVLHTDGADGFRGDLRRIRRNGTNTVADIAHDLVEDALGFKDIQRFAAAVVVDGGGVFVGDDGAYAFHRFGGGRVQQLNARVRHGGKENLAVEHVRQFEIVHVPELSGGFERRVVYGERRADRAVFRLFAHARSASFRSNSAANCTASTMRA